MNDTTEAPSIVKATAKGYYGGVVREAGDTFGLSKPEDFSRSWMVDASPKPAKAEPAKGATEDKTPAKTEAEPAKGDDI